MLGRLVVPLVIMLVGAGCVSPGAQIDAAALARLDTISIEGASAVVLANGDRVFTLVTEVAGVKDFDFDVPLGTTFVEAVIDSEAGPVGVSMRNGQTNKATCIPQTWTGWEQRANGARCTAIAATDPGSKWTVAYFGGEVSTSPFDLLPVAPPADPLARAIAPVPVTLTLTVSSLPLDGSAGLIKLDALSTATHETTETFSKKAYETLSPQPRSAS